MIEQISECPPHDIDFFPVIDEGFIVSSNLTSFNSSSRTKGFGVNLGYKKFGLNVNGNSTRTNDSGIDNAPIEAEVRQTQFTCGICRRCGKTFNIKEATEVKVNAASQNFRDALEKRK